MGHSQLAQGHNCWPEQAAPIGSTNGQKGKGYGRTRPARNCRRLSLKLEQQVCAMELHNDLVILVRRQVNAQIIPSFKGIDVVKVEERIMPASNIVSDVVSDLKECH